MITYKDSVQVAPSQAIYHKNTGKLLQKYRWIIPQIIVKFALVAAMPSVHMYTLTKKRTEFRIIWITLKVVLSIGFQMIQTTYNIIT